jgi:hypothetical protein
VDFELNTYCRSHRHCLQLFVRSLVVGRHRAWQIQGGEAEVQGALLRGHLSCGTRSRGRETFWLWRSTCRTTKGWLVRQLCRLWGCQMAKIRDLKPSYHSASQSRWFPYWHAFRVDNRGGKRERSLPLFMRNGQAATASGFLRASTGFHEKPPYLLIMTETTQKESPNIFFDRNAKMYNIAQLICHSSEMGDDKLLASPAQRHSSLPYAPAIISKLLAGASASNLLSTSFQTHPGSTDWEYVVKFAWPSDERQREGELLKLAKEKGVTGIAVVQS